MIDQYYNVFPKLTPAEWSALCYVIIKHPQPVTLAEYLSYTGEQRKSSKTAFEFLVSVNILFCLDSSLKNKSILKLNPEQDKIAWMSLGLRQKVDGKMKRSAEMKEMIESGCTNAETFLPTVTMTATARQAAYAFFVAMAWDVNKPFSYFTDPQNFKFQVAMLARICDGNLSLIGQAVAKLRSLNYTIASPRSLFNTITSLKNAPAVVSAPETLPEPIKIENPWDIKTAPIF